MNRTRSYYLLIVVSSSILAIFVIDGKKLIGHLYFQEPHFEIIDQTSPETKEFLRQEAVKDSLELIDNMKYFRTPRSIVDTNHIQGYDIIKTHDTVQARHQVYSLIIERNDSVKFRTKIGVEDSDGVIYSLYPLFPNGREQIIVQEYTGGMHCCALYWILDLSDSVRILYQSDETKTDLGSLYRIDDFDRDGYLEFTQLIGAFHYFDGLCGACSPRAIAVFKYSQKTGDFVVANRSFPLVVLEDIEQTKSKVKTFLDTAKVLNGGPSRPLLSMVLDVLIHYVYAGQDSIGWAYFDKNYVLPDKAEMKRKIENVFRKEAVYMGLYKSRGGT